MMTIEQAMDILVDNLSDDELGCRTLYKSDRYVDDLYWDNETCNYVDDDGVPYDLDIVE